MKKTTKQRNGSKLQLKLDSVRLLTTSALGSVQGGAGAECSEPTSISGLTPCKFSGGAC